MAQLTPSRNLAFDIYKECRQRDAYAKNLLHEYFKKSNIDQRDKAFCSRLVLGTVASHGYLSQLIDEYKKPGIRIKPDVKYALELTVFEMLYMGTPCEVAISQGVELVGQVDEFAKGFANALLRTIAQNEAEKHAQLAEVSSDYSFKDLLRLSALPEWLLKKIKKSRPQAYQNIALSNLTYPPVYLYVDETSYDVSELYSQLENLALQPEYTALPTSIKLNAPSKVHSLECLNGQSSCVVSDLAAQAVCLLSYPDPDSLMLEVGQGRATKTLQFESLSSLQGKPAVVIGVDLFDYKTDLAQDRLAHQWHDTTFSLALDATRLDTPFIPMALDNDFDQVFVDVPCSGTGTMRRHPEICWSIQPDAFNRGDEDSLVVLQQRILQAAASKVVEGGQLMYSTCSILKEENEDQIEAFLASDRGKNFKVMSVTDIAFAKDLSDKAYEFIEMHETEEGYFQTTPKSGECDGHFLCVLERIS